MPGQSDQEKASQEQYNTLKGFNPDVKNRFNNYNNPFDYGSMESKVNDVFGGYEDIINRDTAEQISKQQAGAGESLASRGITGGSALTDTQSSIASNVNKSKTNALSNLGIGKSSALADLMKYFNNLKFGETQAATNVDFGNKGNEFNKFTQLGGAIQGLDDNTWFDDLLAGFNTVAGLVPGAGLLLNSGSAGKAGGG